jgi:dienelactone hydrolase
MLKYYLMKKQIKYFVRSALLLPALFFFSCAITSHDHFEFKPINKNGPVVIILSGGGGPNYYLEFASRLSKSGYYAIVFDSRDFMLSDKTAIELKLSEVINKTKLSPNALPGMVAVIGYSRGGGLALAYATNRQDSVSIVIAYYPNIAGPFSFIQKNEIETLPDRFKVPVFVFQGTADDYYDCCRVDRIQKIGAAAKEKGADFNYVLYPGVGHGFNLATDGRLFQYNQYYDEDSWQKTMELLKKYHPLLKIIQ